MSDIDHIVAGEGARFAIAGAQWTWKVRSEDSAGAFCFYEQKIQPGEGVPLHVHSYAEAFYIFEGELLFQSDGHLGKAIVCRRGDTVLARPGVQHAFSNTSAAEARLLSISTPRHQEFFDTVAAADRDQPFATMSPADAFARVAAIGVSTDTRFTQPGVA